MNTTQTITKILATLAILLIVVTGDAAQRRAPAHREATAITIIA